MSGPQTRFQDAASKIRDWKPSQSPSNDEKLAVYSLYKQATVGDVQGDRPGMFSMEARAKYDAWAKRKGGSRLLPAGVRMRAQRPGAWSPLTPRAQAWPRRRRCRRTSTKWSPRCPSTSRRRAAGPGRSGPERSAVHQAQFSLCGGNEFRPGTKSRGRAPLERAAA